MSVLEDHTPESDDGFGPGSDLVLSFLGVLILLIGTLTVTGIPKHEAPAEVPKAVPVTPTPPTDTSTTESESLALANRRISELEARIARMNRRVLAFRFDGTSAAFFEQGSAELSEPAEALLNGSMLAIGRKVLESGANEIVIVGYASPEPSSRSDRDVNLDLSSSRAEAVAHYLARRGVPYACMNIRGVGRSRSEMLYDLFLQRRPGTTLKDWDALFAGEHGRGFTSRLEPQFAAERRVDIVAEQDDESKCSRARLLKALGV